MADAKQRGCGVKYNIVLGRQDVWDGRVWGQGGGAGAVKVVGGIK